MTGFGRAVLDGAQRVTAEVRSVNGRFLKLTVKLPGRYGALEDKIKTLFNDAGVKRGSVDVSVYYEGVSGEGSFRINPNAVRQYVEQARGIAKQLKLTGGLTMSSLLPLPGVVERTELVEDLESVWAQTKQALASAIDAFNGMRDREGQSIVADLRVQLAKLAEHRAAIQQLAPVMVRASIDKYKERIAKLLAEANAGQLDNDAIERETVLMSDRLDVSEELARLQSHFEQMESALAGGGELGKKLDFLTQELFRETNTIGSKAQDERITYRVVEMKGLIERIREQVQNLE